MVTKLYRCQLFLEHTRSKTRKAVPFISKFRVSGAVARYGLTSVHTEEVPQEARHAMRRASWRAPARNAKNRRSSRRGQSGGNAHRHYAILADHDVIGISLDLDRPADGARDDRVFVVVEPHETGLRDRGLRRVETVKWPSDLHEPRPFRVDNLPDRAVGQFGMLVRCGIGDAPGEQPGVQLLVARHPQPRVKKRSRTTRPGSRPGPFPARGRRTGGRLDQVMATSAESGG